MFDWISAFGYVNAFVIILDPRREMTHWNDFCLSMNFIQTKMCLQFDTLSYFYSQKISSLDSIDKANKISVDCVVSLWYKSLQILWTRIGVVSVSALWLISPTLFAIWAVTFDKSMRAWLLIAVCKPWTFRLDLPLTNWIQSNAIENLINYLVHQKPHNWKPMIKFQ